MPESQARDERHAFVELREFIGSDRFSCVGAKTAVSRGSLVHRHFATLGEETDVGRFYGELRAFAERLASVDAHFATFAATFENPRSCDEVTFERLLWRQLQLLHDIDSRRFGWHPEFSPSPESDNFAICVAGCPFFVVGMLHNEASRVSRRFAYPTLVFNSHEQFAQLFELGTFQRLRAEIRRRESALQGSINPNLIHYPEREARHYAGRATGKDWRCPFRPRIRIDGAERADDETDATSGVERSTAVAPRPRVRFARSGIVVSWENDHHESLLDVCLANDLPVPWMCRGGACGSCATPLVTGAIRSLAEPLTDPPPGEVLLCISAPVTDVELDL